MIGKIKVVAMPYSRGNGTTDVLLRYENIVTSIRMYREKKENYAYSAQLTALALRRATKAYTALTKLLTPMEK